MGNVPRMDSISVQLARQTLPAAEFLTRAAADAISHNRVYRRKEGRCAMRANSYARLIACMPLFLGHRYHRVRAEHRGHRQRPAADDAAHLHRHPRLRRLRPPGQLRPLLLLQGQVQLQLRRERRECRQVQEGKGQQGVPGIPRTTYT